MNLVSFDIFDTILIRKCGLPENIFYLTAKKLFGKDDRKVNYFVFWRSQAEGRIIREQKNKDVTIEDIYSSFESDYFGVEIKKAIEAEKNIESENLAVNPEVLDIIKKNRLKGNTICFISDMYLDSSFLRTVLMREGCIEEGEKVYVSCEYKASKHNGTIYRVVKKELSPSKWTHYGDNKHSDVKKAKKQGIKGTLVDTLFTDTEIKTIKYFSLNNNSREISIIVGWLRWIRISMGNSSTSEIASNFIAPLYVSYVQYIFDTAKKQSLDSLYFLNRDSYILYSIAKTLRSGDNINLNYLFVSRRSLVLPAIASLSDDDFLNVFDGKTLIRKSVDGILSFIKTNRKELLDCGLTFAFDEINNKKQQQEVLDKILRSEFTSILKDRIEKENSLLKEYFIQEEVISNKKSAFVDVGWLGTSRLMTNKILSNYLVSPVDFFYLGVRADVLPMKYGEFYSYFRNPIRGLTSVIENYFSISPYKSVLGYRKVEESVVPIFKEEIDTESEKDILDQNIKATSLFAEMINKYSDIMDLDETLTNIASYSTDILLNLSAQIRLDSFLKVGNFDSPLNNNVSFAKKLTIAELFSYSILGNNITAYDNVSIEVSVGKKLSKVLINIHNRIGIVKFAILKRIR